MSLKHWLDMKERCCDVGVTGGWKNGKKIVEIDVLRGERLAAGNS